MMCWSGTCGNRASADKFTVKVSWISQLEYSNAFTVINVKVIKVMKVSQEISVYNIDIYQE